MTTDAKKSWSRGNTIGEQEARRQRQIVAHCYLIGDADPRDIKAEYDIPMTKTREVVKEIEQAGVTPATEILTVRQASILMGVIPRRTRLLCQQGRLGTLIDNRTWIVQRGQLIDFLQREHGSGLPGREAVKADLEQTANA